MPTPLASLALVVGLLLNSSLTCVRGGDDAVLATIGETSITQSQFERFIRSGWANASEDEIRTNQTARNAALEAFFDLQVMAAKARRDGIDQKPTFQMAVHLMEMKLLVKAITDRDRAELLELARDPSGAGKREYMERINAEVELKPTDLATNDSPLVFTWLVASNAVLATLGGTQILESDFQWFLKDAFRPEQRPYVFGQPGARKRLVNSYLSMRALEAKARKDGLDRKPDFTDLRSVMEDKLLAEFLQERDQTTPWSLPGKTPQDREIVLKEYLGQLRSELHFKTGSSSRVLNSPTGSSAVPQVGSSEGEP